MFTSAPLGTISRQDLGWAPQGAFAPNSASSVQQASGEFVGTMEANAPAIFWVALVGLLVVARFLIEYRSRR